MSVGEMVKSPLVTIGIPSYNRADYLKHTLTTVLGQTYSNIDVVVCDNASTDGTQALCHELVTGDPRLRYHRQEINVGPTRNFVEVLQRAEGEYFMWLGDDDWIDPSYVKDCVEFLIANSAYTFVAGSPVYYRDNQFAFKGNGMDLESPFLWSRLFRYFNSVSDNGVFYGVGLTKHLRSIAFGNQLGSDWLLVASMAGLGKIKTLDQVSVHRRLGGATESYEKLAAHLGVGGFSKYFPLVTFGISIFPYFISSRSLTLNPLERLVLAACLSGYVVVRRAIIPDLKRLITGMQFMLKRASP